MIEYYPGAKLTLSPHHSPRHGKTPNAVVIHYDAAPNDTAGVRWMVDPASKVSAHFHIARTGFLTQLVPLDRAAWHAGQSIYSTHTGQREVAPNTTTIGVELANMGLVSKPRAHDVKASHRISSSVIDGYWEPYSDAQIDALEKLLRGLAELGHSAAVENLFGHDEIAVPLGRKLDPGPLFPWWRFRAK